MPTFYAQPAVEVVTPAGEVVPYLVRPLLPLSRERRAWQLTGPGGQCYRVSEYPSGRWGCSCPSALYGRGRRSGAGSCKHVKGVRNAFASEPAAPSAG